MNLSFAGCGFLGIYHVGVAVCFKKYAPHLLLHKISGASAGALAATCLLCDLPLGEMTSDFFRVVKEARSYPLGPFSPSFDIQMSIIEGLTKFLPDDAHERVNGKLNISLTRVYDGKNVIVSHFQSRHDLLQALLCACFIPGFSGILPPRLYGVRYMDGAFSDNLPILDENTITVSPFCGESDICPRDDSAQFFHLNWANTSIELSKQNISRFARILYPPPPEALSIVLKHGYEDALKYLQKNNLINCTRCLSVQSTFLVQESASFDTDDFDPECDECIKYRTDALIGTIPDTVVTVMQTNINSANSGLANWIYKHPSVNFLKILSLPCILPADIFCATLTNIIGDSYEQKLYEYEVVANIIKSSSKKPILPKHYHKNNHKEVSKNNRIFGVKPNLTENVRAISKFILNQLYAAIISKKKVTSNLHCELSITESGNATPKQFIHRTSTIDLKIDDSKLIKNKTDIIPILNQTSSNENNTFDHILQVTSNQEAVYAYYYMDETNKKVKITEIYDLSDDDSPALQTFEEHEINENLEFDNDWNDNSTSSDTMYGGIGNDEPYYNNMIDVGDIIEDYNIFNSCNNNVDNSSSNIDKNYNNDKHITDASWPALQIEEITNDSCDDEQSLITNNASAALRRPSPHSIIY